MDLEQRFEHGESRRWSTVGRGGAKGQRMVVEQRVEHVDGDNYSDVSKGSDRRIWNKKHECLDLSVGLIVRK